MCDFLQLAADPDSNVRSGSELLDRLLKVCLSAASVFTTRCTLVQSAVLRLLIVRLSVTIRYRDHIGWNSSKIISRPNSLGLV